MADTKTPTPDEARAFVAKAETVPQDVSMPQRTSLLRETAYSELIAAAAETHGVDPILVQALIQVESNYNPRSRSPKGAMGLMQLMPAVAREYKVRNAYDPKAKDALDVPVAKP